jgi:predicted RNase H-like HicB family nuclease
LIERPLSAQEYEDDCWFASIPLLPGCITKGATRNEGKEFWLENALAEKKNS